MEKEINPNSAKNSLKRSGSISDLIKKEGKGVWSRQRSFMNTHNMQLPGWKEEQIKSTMVSYADHKQNNKDENLCLKTNGSLNIIVDETEEVLQTEIVEAENIGKKSIEEPREFREWNKYRVMLVFSLLALFIGIVTFIRSWLKKKNNSD